MFQFSLILVSLADLINRDQEESLASPPASVSKDMTQEATGSSGLVYNAWRLGFRVPVGSHKAYVAAERSIAMKAELRYVLSYVARNNANRRLTITLPSQTELQVRSQNILR